MALGQDAKPFGLHRVELLNLIGSVCIESKLIPANFMTLLKVAHQPAMDDLT
jgi:hypothetical protein